MKASKGALTRKLYVHAKGVLSFSPPTEARGAEAANSIVSDQVLEPL